MDVTQSYPADIGTYRPHPWRGCYCTTSVNPLLLVVEPLVALTTTLKDPVGVPGLGGGLWPPPPPPPPQAGRTTVNRSISKTGSPRFRPNFPPPTRTTEKNSPAPTDRRAKKLVCSSP